MTLHQLLKTERWAGHRITLDDTGDGYLLYIWKEGYGPDGESRRVATYQGAGIAELLHNYECDVKVT